MLLLRKWEVLKMRSCENAFIAKMVIATERVLIKENQIISRLFYVEEFVFKSVDELDVMQTICNLKS